MSEGGGQRVARLAAEIRQILGEMLARQEIKDPRVQEAGIITLTHVRLTGDLREATALFSVHGADEPTLVRVARGLNHASGYLRRRLGRELKVRTIPTVKFEIDRVFEREAKVDSLLREIATETAGDAPDAGSAAGADDPDGSDGAGDGGDGKE